MKYAELFYSEELDDDREIKEKFVNEYFKDYNEFKACIRLGFSESYADEFSKRWMTDTYVLRLIDDMELKRSDNRLEKDKSMVMHILRRNLHHVDAKVAMDAAKSMARILRMDQESIDNDESRIVNALYAFAGNTAEL